MAPSSAPRQQQCRCCCGDQSSKRKRSCFFDNINESVVTDDDDSCCIGSPAKDADDDEPQKGGPFAHEHQTGLNSGRVATTAPPCAEQRAVFVPSTIVIDYIRKGSTVARNRLRHFFETQEKLFLESIDGRSRIENSIVDLSCHGVIIFFRATESSVK
jgi:hypothetical protein